MYQFFLPSYFLRILFIYENFSDIFGKEIITNINSDKYNNSFIYVSELDIENFILKLSMINNNVLNKIINHIRPIYEQLCLKFFL